MEIDLILENHLSYAVSHNEHLHSTICVALSNINTFSSHPCALSNGQQFECSSPALIVSKEANLNVSTLGDFIMKNRFSFALCRFHTANWPASKRRGIWKNTHTHILLAHMKNWTHKAIVIVNNSGNGSAICVFAAGHLAMIQWATERLNAVWEKEIVRHAQ